MNLKAEQKRLIIFIISGLSLQSCAFMFYNYRSYLDTEFSIPNNAADTTIRYQAGKLIDRLSSKEKFYHAYVGTLYDSLYFYGPDYHHFRFKIYEDNQTTKIHLRYSGYHGLRSNPPHKQYIQTLADSLKLKFGASQVVIKAVSNEKSGDYYRKDK